ncbi:MAG TPA: insulinase family protein [Elusimicrobia bacterium]|nr:insulinase family protein [Elusimicrobiota bacterium]
MKLSLFLPCFLLFCQPSFAKGTPDASLPEGAVKETDPKYPPVVSYTLKNGLKLIILEKHFAPTISYSMAFKVGNVDSPKGKTGLPHLFEHMAFKGTQTINTKDYKKEKIALDKIEVAARALIAEERKPNPDQPALETLKKALAAAEKEADAYILKDEFSQIYKNLGENGLNAATGYDYTFYTVALPANQLETLMAMEADRFKNAVLREFYRERSVVMEERRMYEAKPESALSELLTTTAFEAHPYRYPIVGWMDDIKTFTRTDAENFYRRFYVPNNATLAIVGDVKPADVIKFAENHFSAWSPAELPDTTYTREPKQNSEKRFNLFFKANPSLRMGFHNPGFSSQDMYPLIMASDVLSGGKTARFYRTLVEGKQLALYAASGATTSSRYPSLFIVVGAPKAPHTVEELETAIWDEIEKLKAEPPTAWEMERIVNAHEAELVKNLESSLETAQSLSVSEQIMGDWKFDWKMIDELRKVTPEDVSKAAAKYLVRSNYTVGFLRQPAAAVPIHGKGDSK